MVIIFWLVFNAESKAHVAPQMEVTLSYHQSDEAPEDASFIAQSNQQGSGEAEKNDELTTLYQSPFNDAAINPVSPVTPIAIPEIEKHEQQIVELRIITTTGNAERSLVKKETPIDEIDVSEDDNEEKTLTELSQEIASLEARLADKQQQFTRKPRVLTLSSASTIEAADANYVHQWRDRVESVGNRYYPQLARNKSLYGDVRLLVKLKANGVVEEISILASSGSEILDRAAIESIRLASPFDPFPKSLANKYDRIDVIRTWQFRKNRLTAKAE
jgi:protein TonB